MFKLSQQIYPQPFSQGAALATQADVCFFFPFVLPCEVSHIGKCLLDFSSTMAPSGLGATVEQRRRPRGAPQAPSFRCCSILMGLVMVRKDSRCSGSFTVSPVQIFLVFDTCCMTKYYSFPNSLFRNNPTHEYWNLVTSQLVLGLGPFPQMLVAPGELILAGLREDRAWRLAEVFATINYQRERRGTE